jgi:hypothetical protein
MLAGPKKNLWLKDTIMLAQKLAHYSVDRHLRHWTVCTLPSVVWTRRIPRERDPREGLPDLGDSTILEQQREPDYFQVSGQAHMPPSVPTCNKVQQKKNIQTNAH